MLPVIALGTSCLTAFVLRRLGFNDAPMPFDWLATSPEMIRHCLQSDFSVLLDRDEYKSLTGRRGPLEPGEGCAHSYYHRAYGLACVFNHSDPTREADYRYLAACVDRFRDALASPGPKMFVQIRHAYGRPVEDFDANCALLNQLTGEANFLQIVVNPANPQRAAPLFTALAGRGAHSLYRMQPTSKMTGQDFLGAVDRDALDAFVGRYAVCGRTDSLVEDIAAAPASIAANLALQNARLVAHIANRGDTGPDRLGWTGGVGSGLAIEGIVIHSDVDLIRECLSYQVAETAGEFSAAARTGMYAGTRGRGKPIYGVRVMCAEAMLATYQVSLEASFIDGTTCGPKTDRNACDCSADVPLEALRLLITDRE